LQRRLRRAARSRDRRASGGRRTRREAARAAAAPARPARARHPARARARDRGSAPPRRRGRARDGAGAMTHDSQTTAGYAPAPMRGALVVLAAVAALWLVAPGSAHAAVCGLPDATPWWVDFADGTVPFRGEFAQPGLIVATSGGALPAALRNAGAQTIYWEMHFEGDVGSPGAPFGSDSIGAAADALLNRAAASSGCSTPVIALNEMLGVTAPPPLSPDATQYRLNVLAFVQELATRGATPILLLASPPNTTGDGGTTYWQQLASYAYLVREVYEPAPKIDALGVGGGSTKLRVDLRTAVQQLTAIGIPASRVGLMLGFQSGGSVGRAGLRPLSSWLEYVKLATLAAKQV